MDWLKDDMLFLIWLLSDRVNALDWCIVDPWQYLSFKKSIQELIDMLTWWESYVYRDNLLLLNPHEFQITKINLKNLPKWLLDEILQFFWEKDIDEFTKNEILDLDNFPNEITIQIFNTYNSYYFDDYKKRIYQHFEKIIDNIWVLQVSEFSTTKTIQLQRLIKEFLKKSIFIFNWLVKTPWQELFRVFVPIDDFIIIKNNKVIFRFGLWKQIHFIKEEDLEKFNSWKLDNQEWPLYIHDQLEDAPDIWIKIWLNKQFICYLNNTKYSLEELENLWDFVWIKDLIEKFLLWIDSILKDEYLI